MRRRAFIAGSLAFAATPAFADHHAFSKAEIESLVAAATRDALTLVTTEKDFVRLRNGDALPDSAKHITPFAVTLEFDDAARLRKFVADRLFKAREKKRSGGD